MDRSDVEDLILLHGIVDLDASLLLNMTAEDRAFLLDRIGGDELAPWYIRVFNPSRPSGNESSTTQ